MSQFSFAHLQRQHSIHQNISSEKITNNQIMSLSPLAQKAITCFKIIQYIKDIEFPTRQNAGDGNFESTQIISIRERLLRDRLVDQGVVQKEHYDQVMKIFKLNEGLPLDRIMRKQESILFASDENTQKHPPTKSLVFFPTHITTKIFKSIIDVDRKQFIFGVAGIGKSISTVLLWHLSNQIIDLRINEDPQLIKDFVDLNKFMKIPQILYLSLQEDATILDFIEQIRLQAPQANYFEQQKEKFLNLYRQQGSKSKKQEHALQFLDQLLGNLSQTFQKHRITTTVVIDEAQNYYKMANRLMTAFKANKSSLTQKLTEKICTISSILKLLRKHFPRVVMLTSQKQEQNDLQKLAKFKEWEEDTLFRLEVPMKAVKCNLEPDFRLDEQYYQMEMYLILWFELCRKFRKEGGILSPEQEGELFDQFMESSQFWFTLQDYAICEVWTRQKTHLTMREAVQKLTQVRKVFSQYFPEHKEKPQKQNNKKQRLTFWDIIKSIQDEAQCLNKFYKQYFHEEKEPFIRMSKFALLMSLSTSQYNEIKFELKHHYCNRFLITKKPKPTQFEGYDQLALKELVKCGHISLENEKMIANHSIMGFAQGCHFLAEEFGAILVNPGLLAKRDFNSAMEGMFK